MVSKRMIIFNDIYRGDYPTLRSHVVGDQQRNYLNQYMYPGIMHTSEFMELRYHLRKAAHRVGMQSDIIAYIRDEITRALDTPADARDNEHRQALHLLREMKAMNAQLETYTHELNDALDKEIAYIEKNYSDPKNKINDTVVQHRGRGRPKKIKK